MKEFYTMAEKEAQYSALNPRGLRQVIDRIPIVPRLPELSGKVVYAVCLKKILTRAFVTAVSEQLAKYAPGVKTVYTAKEGFFTADEPELWDKVVENADAVIVAVGD
jgi:hypothetical protein